MARQIVEAAEEDGPLLRERVDATRHLSRADRLILQQMIFTLQETEDDGTGGGGSGQKGSERPAG